MLSLQLTPDQKEKYDYSASEWKLSKSDNILLKTMGNANLF